MVAASLLSAAKESAATIATAMICRQRQLEREVPIRRAVSNSARKANGV